MKTLILMMALGAPGMRSIVCVQTQDIPVLLPQAFIQASSILQDIEKEPQLRKFKLRALFEDQPSCIIVRVIEDQAALTTGSFVGSNGLKTEGIAYCLALIRRLKLDALHAAYAKLINISGD